MAQVSFRIDDKIKKDAEQVCDDIGISMSAAITIYLKRLGKERRIPFDLVADPFYSSKDIEVLDFENNWLKIKFNYKGRSYNGWLSPEMQCANPYTTCS